jgi:putative sigma-54 modulation protein
MDVKFSLRGTVLNDSLKAYMEEKMGKLEKFFSRLFGCSINISEVKGFFTVEVTANANGVILRGEEKGMELRSAFDQALKNLERQIKRHNSYLKDKAQYRAESGVFSFSLEEAAARESTLGDDLGIVKSKKVPLIPMDAQEAIMQMDLLGHEFFMFHNGDTGQVNVVYRRRNGGYGLLEPQS